MARSVDEINYGAMVMVGNQRQTPNMELTVEIKFTRNDGTKDVQTRTPNFPNYVQTRMPANIYKERMTALMIECLRVQVGADVWPEGSDTVTITGVVVP